MASSCTATYDIRAFRVPFTTNIIPVTAQNLLRRPFRRNYSLTSTSLPLFLNTIIRFLFSIASAAIFSITNFRTNVRSMCAGTVVRRLQNFAFPQSKLSNGSFYIYMYISRYPLPIFATDLFQSISTTAFRFTIHQTRYTYVNMQYHA